MLLRRLSSELYSNCQFNPLTIKCLQRRFISRRPSHNRQTPYTYEDYNLPFTVGVRKSWNSLNSSALSEVRQAEIAHEDLFIRKFIYSTFPYLLASQTIIKRRANLIVLNFILTRNFEPSRLSFLAGYTEEILSYVTKCPVKLEIQTVEHKSHLTYRLI